MKSMMAFGGRALVAGIVAAAAGCASVPVGIPEKIDPATGVVAVKVVGVQRVSITNAKWTQLTFVEKTTGVPVVVNDSAPIGANYAMFAQTVPPGTYAIKAFDAPGVAPGGFGILPALVFMALTSDNHGGHERLGTFKVEAGGVTNLGLMVTAQPDGNSNDAQMAIVADSLGQAAVIDDLEAGARERLKPLRTLSWDQAPGEASADRAREIVRTRTTNLSAIDTTSDQRLVFGSALGLVHMRDTSGRWQTLSTGSLDTITHVRVLPQGRILAASDNGNYHLWQPRDRSWVSRKLSTTGQVIASEPMGDDGVALLVKAHSWPGQRFVMNHSVLVVRDLAGSGPAQEVLSLDDFPALGAPPLFFDGRELIVIMNQQGFSRTADVYRIDPKTLARRTEKLDNWTGRLYRLPDGTLMRDRMNGLSAYNDVSDDDGKTWQLGNGSGPFATRFANRNEGYGLSLVSMGMKSSTFTLSKTTDGGKTWQPVGTPLESGSTSTPLQLQLAGNLPLVFTGRQLLSTIDDGKTWRTEWPLAAAK